MRRFAPFALLAFLLAGCGGVPGRGPTTTPTPATILGTPPTPPATIVGVAAAGKPVFVAAGCGACHTFTPAAAKGTIGPNLDLLKTYASKAGVPIEEFTTSAIASPPASYVPPGYSANIMPGNYGTTLTAKQLADLVAFLVKTP